MNRKVDGFEPAPDDLFTPKQVSEKTNIATMTLAIWRCRGDRKLAWVKIGARVYYRRADVENFIRRHRVPLPRAKRTAAA
jgi:Helix-turn-helix domain